MTHTTTDAAEARARAMAMLDSLIGGRRNLYSRGQVIDAMIAFATAEAASGAGEREKLRAMSDRATAGPWAWEQCGEKEDAPVVGIIFPADDHDCKKPYAGEVRGDDDAYRVTIAYDWQWCDGHSPAANASFAVACVNYVRSILALAAAPTIPATGEAIRAVTAEMRRFMPTACGDWADKIDDALAEEKGRKVAFYDEGGIDIRPGESLADRDRRIYQQGRHDALNDEPEAFI